MMRSHITHSNRPASAVNSKKQKQQAKGKGKARRQSQKAKAKAKAKPEGKARRQRQRQSQKANAKAQGNTAQPHSTQQKYNATASMASAVSTTHTSVAS